MNCYTIPASEPFMRTLAHWVLSEYGHNPSLFTSTVILLPGRRACRSLREVFLDITNGKPLLLPRIQPIGDIEDNPYLLAPAIEMHPPINPLRRQLLLMRLVSDFERQRYGRIHNLQKAAQLATQLATLIDDVEREGLDFSGLDALVPEELQEHWQQTLDFLKIISLHWPDVLASEGASNPVIYRNSAIKNLAENLRRNPPEFPIIAAGSTGSQPATAALLATIAALPQGRVIIPALDQNLSEQEWKQLGETHPQFMLKQLLENIGCKYTDVKPLIHHKPSAREVCLSDIFKPAQSTSGWQYSTSDFGSGLNNVHILEAETVLDEARMIALLLRNVLEVPEKTTALITPDRVLARMVAAQMQRFGIIIDDSAGKRLKDTPTATFLQLVLEAVASGMSPVVLLALLRHPMAACGIMPHECRKFAAIMDKHLLRGIRKEAGLQDLIDTATNNNFPALANFLSTLASHIEPLAEAFQQKRNLPLKELLERHIQLAEWMASTPDETGAEKLWSRESGSHAAAWLSSLNEHADILSAIDPHIYAATFDTLMAQQTYWPQHTQHPRIHILSPIEARLLRFDCVFLSGLTEKTWPQHAEPDPWMSRPMRLKFGLPSAERGIGQAAHDVYYHAHAEEVYLTRARKTDGTRTVDSRWLVRLETLVGAKNAEMFEGITNQNHINRAKDFLDAPIALAALTVPEPRPPVSARPIRMSATGIDRWIADPYVIYAKHILRLKPLEELDKDPDAADLGKTIHTALDMFTRQFPAQLPENAFESLLECGRQAFVPFAHQPAVACLWWPRFETIAEWFIEQEQERRRTITELLSEVEGNWQCDVNGKPFTLTTRIDRLEIHKDRSMVIADYKTGYIPDSTEMKHGLGNQLYVEALIAEHGTLLPKPQMLIRTVTNLEYWKLAATKNGSEIKAVAASAEILTQRQAALYELIAAYQDASQPYRAQENPRLKLRYNDYEHLTRRAEWENV
ncbi:MAG: double-strand break repair protein AddB [Alphaproteobacteria bacterium]